MDLAARTMGTGNLIFRRFGVSASWGEFYFISEYGGQRLELVDADG